MNREEHLSNEFPTGDGKTYIQSLDECNSKSARKVEMSERWKKMVEKIKTPEYKERRLKEKKEQKDKLTSEYQFGYYVGEDIVRRFLPTITTDSLLTRTQIKVSDEDSEENKRLYDEWWETSKYGSNPDVNKNKENWDLYHQHNKMLEKEYLPNPLKCHMSLMNIRDEKDFKEGLIHSLWDCDMCSYSLKPEDIKIYDDEDLWFTIIEFVLRDEE